MVCIVSSTSSVKPLSNVMLFTVQVAHLMQHVLRLNFCELNLHDKCTQRAVCTGAAYLFSFFVSLFFPKLNRQCLEIINISLHSIAGMI